MRHACYTRALSCTTLADLADLAAAPPSSPSSPVIALLSDAGRRVERYEDERAPAPLDLTPLDLTPDGVALITGGARGITALCARELPLRGRLTLLCGRTPDPEAADEPDRDTLERLSDLPDDLSERRLKALVSERLADLNLHPRELTRLTARLTARREVQTQLSALRALGAHPRYLPVDASNPAALTAAVSAALPPSERVAVVLHGAGVIEDKRLSDKTLHSFRRVCAVKINGARALLRAAPDAEAWVLFSSVSAALGNVGQTDYAAANAALDALCEQLAPRALSLQWGPWGGAGIVSEALARVYERAGIQLISLEEGAAAFRAELSGARGVVLRSWPFER